MFKTLTAGVRAQLRLAFAFAIVIAISILSTGLAIYRLGELAQNTEDITSQPLAKERAVAAWLVNTSTATKRVAAVARSVASDPAAYFAKESKASTEVSGQLQAQVKALPSTADEKAMFATIGMLRQRYLDEREATPCDMHVTRALRPGPSCLEYTSVGETDEKSYFLKPLLFCR